MPNSSFSCWTMSTRSLHALAMLKIKRDGIEPDVDGSVAPLKQMEGLKEKGLPLAYVGDVVGTGSSRKSATNSVLWFMGDDIPYVPNKRAGGVCIGGKIAPLIGASPHEVIACDSTSVNLFKLIAAALEMRPGRKTVLSEPGNFPTDLYMIEGLEKQGLAKRRLAPREQLACALDEDVALLLLTHAHYKTGKVVDMAAMTAIVDAAWRRSAAVAPIPNSKLHLYALDGKPGCPV